jgi:hypothetical protein
MLLVRYMYLNFHCKNSKCLDLMNKCTWSDHGNQFKLYLDANNLGCYLSAKQHFNYTFPVPILSFHDSLD